MAAISRCKSLYASSFTSFPAAAICFSASVSSFIFSSVCCTACFKSTCFCSSSSVFLGSSFKSELTPFSSFCRLAASAFGFSSAFTRFSVLPFISTVIPFSAFPILPRLSEKITQPLSVWLCLNQCSCVLQILAPLFRMIARMYKSVPPVLQIVDILQFFNFIHIQSCVLMY